MTAILSPFYQLISKLEFELARDIVLYELFCLVFAIVGGTLYVDTVPKVLFDEQDRAALLFLIAERRQPSGINKGTLLGKIVTEVREDSTLFVLHVA